MKYLNQAALAVITGFLTAIALMVVAALLIPTIDDSPPPPDLPALSEEGAFQAVLELPEVHAFSLRVRQNSQGVVSALAYVEEEPSPKTWNFYVGESHPDHTVRWATFQVDGTLRDIRVWDGTKDSFIALEQWRSRVR